MKASTVFFTVLAAIAAVLLLALAVKCHAGSGIVTVAPGEVRYIPGGPATSLLIRTAGPVTLAPDSPWATLSHVGDEWTASGPEIQGNHEYRIFLVAGCPDIRVEGTQTDPYLLRYECERTGGTLPAERATWGGVKGLWR